MRLNYIVLHTHWTDSHWGHSPEVVVKSTVSVDTMPEDEGLLFLLIVVGRSTRKLPRIYPQKPLKKFPEIGSKSARKRIREIHRGRRLRKVLKENNLNN